MKRKALLALLVVLALVCVMALASCEGIVVPGLTDGTSGNGGTTNNNGGNNSGNNGNNGNTATNTTYFVKYYYDGSVVHQQTVKSGNTLTSFQLEEKDELGSNGTYFTGFFADSEMTTEFDFDMKITRDVNVYCQILYTVSYYYGTTKVAEHEVDAVRGYLTQEQADEVVNMSSAYTGLFTDKAKTVPFDPTAKVIRSFDVYCQDLFVIDYVYIDSLGTETKIEGLRQRVDTFDGFTDEQKAAVYEYLHAGFAFDYFSADPSMAAPFDFDTPPKKNTTVYCERDESKAGRNIYWEISADMKTITFTGSGDMYDYAYNTDVPWYAAGAMIENVVIEDGITSVAGCAFYKFNKIGTVTLPDTIKRINKNAFYMSSVSEINFPSALETIGTSAFTKCNNLVHLDFNEGLINIENNAFADCESLTTVVLTPTIMGFGASAFDNCTNIESAYYIGTEEQFENIHISISNFWIDQLAHKYFISQERPAAPGPYWYYGENGEICQWYYTIWYYDHPNAKLPFTADYIDVEEGIVQANIDFMNNGTEENGTGHNGYKFVSWYLKGDKASNVYNFTLGTKYSENIKLIGNRGNLCGDNVSWNFDRATGVLTISKIDPAGDGVMWDFRYSNDAPWWESYRGRIKNIVIGDDITHIGSYAFSEIFDSTQTTYANLSYIVIPKSVTSIDVNAFYRCHRLLYIYYMGTPDELYGTENSDPIIEGLAELECLSVEATSTVLYANATGLDFSTLGAGSYWAQMTTSAAVNNNLRVAWSYDDATGTLIVGGGDDKHIMINYDSHEQTPWYSYRDSVSTVIINKNITTVGHHSFEGMESVTNIVASELIAKTSATAFAGTGYYNTELAEKGVVYIYTEGAEALRYSHLIKVDPAKAGELFIIPDKTLSVAEQAFADCVSVKKLVFTKDIKIDAVYSTAFAGLTALEQIFFNGNIATWGSYQNVPEVQVLHYFKNEPTSGTLESYGLTLADCWHWQNNKENTVPVIWGE